MSDLCMYELEDIVWEEFCQSDDHIVPHPGDEQTKDNFFQSDNRKKARRESTGILSNSGDRCATKYDGQEKECLDRFCLNNKKNLMLEKDSWSHTPNNSVFPSSCDSDSMKEVSITASDSTRTSSQDLKSNKTDAMDNDFVANDPILNEKGTATDSNSYSYQLGDISQADNGLSFFDNNPEDKDPNDILYCGWPEIGNFDDVDRMFRSCDSTFGLGPSKEDDLGWFSSSDPVGESGDVLKSDFKFPSSESDIMGENHDSATLNVNYSVRDPTVKGTSLKCKDSAWSSEKDESATFSHLSFVNDPTCFESKDQFLPEEQGLGQNGNVNSRISTDNHSKTGIGGMVHEQRKQSKNQNRLEGKRKGQYIGNGCSFDHISNHTNEVIQLPSGATSLPIQQQQETLQSDSFAYFENNVPYVHLENNYPSDQTSVHRSLSAIKSENNEFTSFSPKDDSHGSNQVQSLDSTQGPTFQVTSLPTSKKREKLHNQHSARSSLNSSPRAMPVDKKVNYPGDQFEEPNGIEGVSMAFPSELGSSNVQDRTSTSSGLDDISLEAASFRQLQHVMERLDLRTKLCIRDSLYRLARSAEQRHNHANIDGGTRDDRDPSGSLMAEGTNKCTGFMDVETNTNPIDRSIAHLLFHRPSDSSIAPPHDPMAFQPLSAAHGSLPNPPLTAEKSLNHEECAETEAITDN